MRKIKIIIPTSEDKIGGQRTVANEFNEAFRLVGSSATLCYIPLNRTEIKSRRSFKNLKSLFENSDDVIMCLGKEVTLLVAIMRFLLGKSNKIIFYSMTHNSAHLQAKGFIRNILYSTIYIILFKKVDLVWAHSHSMVEDLRKRFFVDDGKLVMSYLNIADSFFSPLVTRRSLDKKTVLFIGRIEEEKQLHIFIRKFTSYLEQHKHVGLDVVGDGSQLSELKTYIDQKKLQGRVNFLGPSRDVVPALNSADVLILPSRFEGFGLVLAEANARGVPAITFDLNGPNEIIMNGVNGYLVPPQDFDGFVTSVDRALSSPMDPNTIAQSAQRFSRQRVIEFLQTNALMKRMIFY